MKRILILSIVLALFIAPASAQRRADGIRSHRIEKSFDNGQLTRSEKFRLQNNRVRYKAERRRSVRDGRVTPLERRRLHKIKRHDRRETFRLKHNGRRRLI